MRSTKSTIAAWLLLIAIQPNVAICQTQDVDALINEYELVQKDWTAMVSQTNSQGRFAPVASASSLTTMVHRMTTILRDIHEARHRGITEAQQAKLESITTNYVAIQMRIAEKLKIQLETADSLPPLLLDRSQPTHRETNAFEIGSWPLEACVRIKSNALERLKADPSSEADRLFLAQAQYRLGELDAARETFQWIADNSRIWREEALNTVTKISQAISNQSMSTP